MSTYYRVTYYQDGHRYEVKQPAALSERGIMQWASEQFGLGLIRVDVVNEEPDRPTLTDKLWSVSDYDEREVAMAELGKKIWEPA